MALESEVNFKAAAALAAVQLTVMWQDTVKTEMAAVIKNPHHPLRDLNRLFSEDPATGVVVSRDSYIAAAYAGSGYNVPYLTGEKVGTILPVLVSADIEIAAPRDIVLVFDDNITGFQDVAIGGAGSAGKTIAGIAVEGATVTITVSADYIAADVVTVDGLFRNGNVGLTLAAEAVTNNIV